MADNGKAGKDAKSRRDETPASPPQEAEPGPETAGAFEPRSVPLPPGPDLILDERLNSAAAPFLYLLAIILIAVAGYFVYIFVRS
ncbi:MAG: hypothetical protein WAN43_10915 [Rhodomicrobium sp.]